MGESARFETIFHRAPTVVADAPGRVNLIGEHTDYNQGFVLPAAIPQRTVVSFAPRADAVVQVASAQEGDALMTYVLGDERPGRGWVDYVAGLTWLLGRSGAKMSGFDAYIDSDVPLGSGLSSSAALSVAMLRALRRGLSLALEDRALALLAQRSENEFVGAPVGVMDPMACHFCDGERTAIFLDTRDLAFERIALPAAADIVVIDSGIRHAHATGDYRTRRAECEEACRALGVPSLRALTPADLPRALRLRSPLGRRVRHVVTENARVLAAVDAMRKEDVASLGALFNASHASMRDDYEVSIPEIDRLVAIAQRDPGVLGARLTGGGFGGAVVLLVSRGGPRAAATRVAQEYAASADVPPRVLVPEPSKG